MKTTQLLIGFFGAVLLLTASVIFPQSSLAHCDTLDEPVVATARLALENGDVTPLLKWVRAEEENEIKTAFQKTLDVRQKGQRQKN
jgi:hypothetical protein